MPHDTTKYQAPANGDYSAYLSKQNAIAQTENTETHTSLWRSLIWLPLFPLVLLFWLIESLHLLALFAIGLVCLYVGVVKFHEVTWLVTFASFAAGLILTLGVSWYAWDKIRGKS